MIKKITLTLALFSAIITYAQNLTYVTFPGGLNDLAAYSTLFNTQNTRNDSMHVQRYLLSDFGLSGTKIINSIKGRFVNPSTSPNNVAQADLVIYDMDNSGLPGNLLHSVTINVSNSVNGNGTTYKDITTNVPGISVTDYFYVGIRTKGVDVVQFYVGNAGCGCMNSWLYGPSGINTGDDSWRSLVSRHASQDLNFYFEVNVSNVVTNQAPVVANDIASTAFQTPVVIDVLANDSDDVSLNNSSVSVTTQPSNGTTSVNSSTGAITYTPNAGFSGVNTFSYQVCDNASTALCSSGNITVTVGGLGIVEESLKVVVSPNPVSDFFTVESSSMINSISLVNLNGKEVVRSKSNVIGVGNLCEGIYILNIEFTDGFKSVSRIIKY